MNAELSVLWDAGTSTEAMTAALMRAVPRRAWVQPDLWRAVAEDRFADWLTDHDAQVYDRACEGYRRAAPTAWRSFMLANGRGHFNGDDRLLCQAIGAHLRRVVEDDAARVKEDLKVIEMRVIDRLHEVLKG